MQFTFCKQEQAPFLSIFTEKDTFLISIMSARVLFKNSTRDVHLFHLNFICS